MNLENVKVGDWIKVQVTEIKDSDVFPIICGDGLTFRKNGTYCLNKQVAFPTEETERWMLVSNCGEDWLKRKVITQKNGKFLAWIFAENDEVLNSVSDATSWDFAKEIETKIEFNLELSLEEIAEKFGVNVEQIKIKK
jgi:hypothetical protein